MAQIRRHRAIAAALAALAGLFLSHALAQGQAPVAGNGTDLFDQPVLAVDPSMHSASIWVQAVDSQGQFVVTGGADRTVRIWAVADGRLLRTIWIPIGPDSVGVIYAVAISSDGATIAAGGCGERASCDAAIYLFARDTGEMIRRIPGEGPDTINSLAFSADGRYLAATLGRGLRVFDQEKAWGESFRDDSYSGYGAATFAPDGRLATTSTAQGGTIRLYDSDFRLVAGPTRAPSGAQPFGVAFSPDGQRLAVGYNQIGAVDILDAHSLVRQPGPSPTRAGIRGLLKVAWSRDGGTLYAAGGVWNATGAYVLAWSDGGLGKERRLQHCGTFGASGLDVLPDERLVVSSILPCMSLMSAAGDTIWSNPSPIADFRGQNDELKVSPDGKIVDFSIGDITDFSLQRQAGTHLRFDLRTLRLSIRSSPDASTYAADREGLPITGWRNGYSPKLADRAIATAPGDMKRSLAVARDRSRFFVGSDFYLYAYDSAGHLKWVRPMRSAIWAVDATGDGRLAVTAHNDGAIRWRRADDGRELLALQVLPNKTDWVLWTPEGFYEATPGARDVLKWVVNHGPDSPATTLPVSAFPTLHRPDALPLVLDELETARALGVADVASARLAVQQATGSLKPPGGVLHVLAIGVDKFGDKAGGLALNYAAEDAHDVATALIESQKGAPERPSLYADVSSQYLVNENASRVGILEAMDKIAIGMRKSPADDDVAVILVSSHGEMIEGQFYLVPFGFDATTPTAMETSAVSADEFARKVKALAERGKVLLLIDACHSGAVGPGGSGPDASVLRTALTMDNVTVLTSSAKDELSQELPRWGHGAFTQAFLDALSGGADPDRHGVISTPDLIKAMDRDLNDLTRGRQHLGPRMNFVGDVFVVSR